MAVSRSKSGKLARLAIQVDTTQFLPQHTRNTGFFSLIHSVNRTALIFYINLEPIVRIFLIAMVSLFALYKLWEIISLLIKLALSVQELLQNRKAGSVADADLRNFRQINNLIRSWRARTEERRQLMQQQRRRY
jgi:hypothetical protein